MELKKSKQEEGLKNLKLKSIDLEKEFFEANGKKYYIESGLSIERFEQYEQLEIHVGFGRDFKTIYDDLKKAWEHFNAGTPADGFVIVHNVMNGIATALEKREHPGMLMCTLFINEENEDRVKWDINMAKRKIKDWKEAGYDVNDFFVLAFSFVQGFVPIYNELIQDISKDVVKGMRKTNKDLVSKSTGLKNPGK